MRQSNMETPSRTSLLCALLLSLCLQSGWTARSRHISPRGPPLLEFGQRTNVPVLSTPKIQSEVPATEASVRQVVTSTPCPPKYRPTTTAPQKWLRSLCLTRRGLFPHPLDCRKYLDCWDGRVFEIYCPNNLVFSDLDGGFCDYLEYVDCGTRPVLESNKPTYVIPQDNATSPIPNGEYWLSMADGTVPPGSMESGYEYNVMDSFIFVGRTFVDQHLLPCSVVRGQGCRVAWNNTDYMFHEYEVLVKTNITWIAITNSIPSKALKVGYLNFGSLLEILYMGRAYINEELVSGYFTETRPQLVQTINGTTYFADTFEILTLT